MDVGSFKNMCALEARSRLAPTRLVQNGHVDRGMLTSLRAS